MFMSTRYSKKSETSMKIFSVNDSLAKLCEYLTGEFTCSKLITCKYKDFRSTKIKFEQKTRLNNAIWRAWHIQYKQKKKARFLQFAAPFSDETHSISQAVILEGKYWKWRLDKVSRDYRKWRRHLEDKLLRSGGFSKEQLEIDESGSETEDEVDVLRTGPIRKDPPSNDTVKSSSHDSFEMDSFAMNSFPDTLFSCVEKQTKTTDDLALYKDSSGMMQPTLDHLNPCFDDFMENFDFLFNDWGTNAAYQSNVDPNSPNILLDNSPYNTTQTPQPVPYLKDDDFFQPESMTNNFQEVIYPNPQSGRHPNQSVLKNSISVTDISLNTPEPEKQANFEEIPPTLQAPNLTARLQAAMSSRPKPPSRNNSDSNLSSLPQRSKKDNCSVVVKKPRIRRNTSNPSLQDARESGLPNKAECSKVFDDSANSQNFYYASSTNVNSTPLKVNAVLPKSHIPSSSLSSALANYTNTVMPSSHFPPSTQPSILISPESHRSTEGINFKNNTQSAFRAFTPVTSLSDEFVDSICATTHPVSTIAKIAPMPSTNQQPLLSSSQHASRVHPHLQRNNSRSGNSSQLDALMQISLNPGSANLPQSNDQQLQLFAQLLAQLLQGAPSQSAEATMGYLELLQQHLNLMKQQQERIQMENQLQAQAEKMLQQQQQHQHSNLPQPEPMAPSFNPEFVEATSSNPLHFIATSSGNHNRKFDITSSQVTPTTCAPSVIHPTHPASHAMWTGTSNSATYTNNRYYSSTCISKSPSGRMTDPLPSKSLKMSDFLPASSPKVYNKNKSLVSKLHRMEETTEPTSEEISFYDSVRKLSQTTPPASLPSSQPPTPTTLDSAIALVSLGTMAPLSNDDALGRPSISPCGPSVPLSFTDLSMQGPYKGSSKFNDESSVHPTGSVPPTIKGGPEPISTASVPGEHSERSPYNEHRRQCHLSAEQKRRGIIKNAFEELGRILPGNRVDGRPAKLSNASILEQACSHIVFLQQECSASDHRLKQLQQEIDTVHAAINDCQNKLPATGVSVPRQDSDNIRKNYFSFCKEMIYMNPKSWIFCVILRPLFDSFNKRVSTKTVEEFLNSIWLWLDRHCSLPVLRPVVIETLTKLSSNTAVLEDPNCLTILAGAALRSEDPTAINKVGNVEESPPAGPSAYAHPSGWDRMPWRK